MRHVLITGATGGIARAVIPHLGDAQLTLVARTADRLAELAGSLPDATAIPADLTTEAGADAVAAHLAGQPPLTGAVHAVGSLWLKPAHRTSFAEWRAVLAANLDSAFLVLRLVTQARVQQAKSESAPLPMSLVLCSSVAAGLGLPNHEAIAAAKAGIEGLVRSAAASYAAQGLRINAIAPGLTETPLTAAITASTQLRSSLIQQHPLGRLGTADDQVAAIIWLLSDAASWITGQVLGVDGGYGAIRR